jgi:DNA-binding CsgD family transcriptional regulator
MTGDSLLKDRDLRLILGIVEEGHRDDPGESMPWSVLEGLSRLVDGEIVGFAEQDHERQFQLTTQDLAEGERSFATQDHARGDDEMFFSMFWGSYCSYPQRTGDLASIITESDFSTLADRRKDPMWVDYLWPAGIEHCLILSLPTAPGQTRRVLLQRGPGPGYTERDRQVLALLRPHLYEIWLAAERRRNGAPTLTNREWEVLRLSGSGLSNAEIAQRLFLAPGTVRKHMEHIMERLNVHNRAAAAAIALPHAPHVIDLVRR